jgi:ribosomal protein S2
MLNYTLINLSKSGFFFGGTSSRTFQKVTVPFLFFSRNNFFIIDVVDFLFYKKRFLYFFQNFFLKQVPIFFIFQSYLFSSKLSEKVTKFFDFIKYRGGNFLYTEKDSFSFVLYNYKKTLENLNFLISSSININYNYKLYNLYTSLRRLRSNFFFKRYDFKFLYRYNYVFDLMFKKKKKNFKKYYNLNVFFSFFYNSKFFDFFNFSGYDFFMNNLKDKFILLKNKKKYIDITIFLGYYNYYKLLFIFIFLNKKNKNKSYYNINYSGFSFIKNFNYVVLKKKMRVRSKLNYFLKNNLKKRYKLLYFINKKILKIGRWLRFIWKRKLFLNKHFNLFFFFNFLLNLKKEIRSFSFFDLENGFKNNNSNLLKNNLSVSRFFYDLKNIYLKEKFFIWDERWLNGGLTNFYGLKKTLTQDFFAFRKLEKIPHFIFLLHMDNTDIFYNETYTMGVPIAGLSNLSSNINYFQYFIPMNNLNSDTLYFFFLLVLESFVRAFLKELNTIN